MTESSAVVKTKVDRSAGDPRLLVGETEVRPQEISASGVATFHLEGLTPETGYDYRVAVSEGVFLSGRFQTLAQGPSSFRFAFGSCARTGSNHRIFETMESLEPLFTLDMGDFHCENIAENDPAKFQRAFDEVLASARQSSLYRSAPIAYVWDDHDYGPNDADRTHPGRSAALATYDEYVPHYPLERDDGLPRDLHQAFTSGRVRFLLTDVRSQRVPDGTPEGPDKTMLGVAQREWLLGEIEASRDRFALVVWVNPVPWITEPGSSHGWGRYDWERRYIADRIRDAGMTERLLMLSGDAHMVAIDDGTNSNFATGRAAGERGFPVMHGAPLDRYARPKGGPTATASRDGESSSASQIQQFGLAEVRDDGKVLEVLLSGRNGEGRLLEGMSLNLRGDEGGCRTVRRSAVARASSRETRRSRHLELVPFHPAARRDPARPLPSQARPLGSDASGTPVCRVATAQLPHPSRRPRGVPPAHPGDRPKGLHPQTRDPPRVRHPRRDSPARRPHAVSRLRRGSLASLGRGGSLHGEANAEGHGAGP